MMPKLIAEDEYAGVNAKVYYGDCIEVMKTLEDNSVHAVVTDPPYAIEFDGDKDWDTFKSSKAFGQWCEDWSREALRILKPGGHMLAFGGSRMFHRLACGMEDAGFEIRDVIGWIYSQGFPAGVDISKEIDKIKGQKRKVIGFKYGTNAPGLGKGMGGGKSKRVELEVTEAASAEAKRWAGWHTALKPSFEPIVVGRKPLAAGTVASNVLAHDAGGINIGAAMPSIEDPPLMQEGILDLIESDQTKELIESSTWPPNVVFSHALGCTEHGCIPGCQFRELHVQTTTADVFPAFRHNSKAKGSERPKVKTENGETLHTTVKPYELIRWLVKLVTPVGGTVLEPFAGSGTCIQVCLTDEFNCIAIERDPEYFLLIRARLEKIPGITLMEYAEEVGVV